MAAPWRVIDLIDFAGEIYSRRGAIVLQYVDSDTCHTLPVAEVAVVMLGTKVRFSAGVMHRLLGAGTTVVLCDWRGVPEGVALPYADHSRIGIRQRSQCSMSVPRCKSAWARIVKAKVRGQANVLGHLGIPAERVRRLADAVRSGDSTNVEAQAARLYWQSLLAGEGRHPGNRDSAGYNACLDYAYTVLRGFGIRAAQAAGLNCSVGVFHRNRENQFNLVDDLIEPFRPAIDEAVFRLPVGSSPCDPETKHVLVAAATQKFLMSGETIPSVLQSFAQHFGNYCEGEVEKLSVPIWQVDLGTMGDSKDG